MYKIEFKVKELMEKHNLSARKVALACRIRPDTVGMYVNNEIKRIGKDDLEMLYTYFKKLDKDLTLEDIIKLKFIP